jgi:hypothetical protein
MADVPAEIPVTIPVVDTVATAGVLLLHVPPTTLCVSVVVVFWQREALPPIGSGARLTVTVFVAKQPVVRV